MAIDNFIPVLWSARLLENLHKTLVYGAEGIVNREYEGEIAGQGSSVKISSIGAVTVGSYNKNNNISDPETLSDAQAVLLIDQARFFNFQVDDVDRVQQKPKLMDVAMQEAAYALRNTMDQYIAMKYGEAGNALGSDASPTTVGTGGTDKNAYEILVDLGVLLDEDNIPPEGRWVIVPPWYHGLLLKDQRFVSFGTPENTATLRNGRIGQAAGFTVLKSNNVPSTAGTKYKIMAGHAMAITFATQIMSVEAYRPEKRFADAVKGLAVYGCKVIRPDALAVLTANKGS
jgi:hypothetical protein